MHKSKRMVTEKQFMDGARMAVQTIGARVFRNNNGVARFEDNGKKRVIRYGLGKGTSDLIGWTPLVITKEIVGTTVAVFTALEGKKNPRDKLSEEQENFLSAVDQDGGVSGVFRSSDEALGVVNSWIRQLRKEQS